MGYLEWEYGCTINNLSVNGKIDIQSKYAGGIIGGIKDGTIMRCNNLATVEGGNPMHGGICGRADKSTITKCKNLASVEGGNPRHGGICGYVEESTIAECTNSGSVTGSPNSGQINADVGGIVGYIGNSSVQKCKNTASITANEGWNVGGIVGTAAGNSAIELCYNKGEVTQLRKWYYSRCRWDFRPYCWLWRGDCTKLLQFR